MVLLRPDIHCPHVGPTGGDMCSKYSRLLRVDFPVGTTMTVDRNYFDVVYNVPYTESLVAFNATC